MNIESFRDPSKIPNSIKFLTMVLLLGSTLVGGYFLDTNDQIESLNGLTAKEEELRTTWLDKKKQAVNLSAHEKQLADIEVSFGTLLRQLPNKSQMDALLNDVNQAGVGRGLNFELFRPASSENLTQYYAEQPVAILISGSFHDVGSFAEDISKLSRIVNLDNMTMKTSTDIGAILRGTAPKITLEATVKTYRYLDDKDGKAKK